MQNLNDQINQNYEIEEINTSSTIFEAFKLSVKMNWKHCKTENDYDMNIDICYLKYFPTINYCC